MFRKSGHAVKANKAANGVFPDGRLVHLVRAATDARNVRKHWSSYVAGTAHSFPNEGEFRLFPLIAHHMDSLEGIEAAIWLSEAKGWAISRRRHIAAALEYVTPILLDHDIPLIWTKGTALATTVYPDPDLRPSGDLDGLLAWDHLPRLTALAEKLGWTSYLGQSGPAAGNRYRGSELSWKLPGGVALDVGWMPRRTFAFDPFMMERVVANARRAPDQLAVADTTWLFIEAIEHGLSANPVWPIRWVVDALRLIEISGAQIDWEFLLDIAQRYKMQSLMLLGLETLSAFTPEIPGKVIATLSRHQPTRLERDELSARLNLATVKDNFLVGQRYNVVQRAPLRIYARNVPTPFGKQREQSITLRSAIAARNIQANLIGPFLRSR